MGTADNIADYRLLQKIGEGAAGEVFLATPTKQMAFAKPGDPLAIKIYRPEILRQAAESLKNTEIPTIFCETTYADPEYRQWIITAYRSAFHRDPQEVLFWPLHSMTSQCNFDVVPPYSLKNAVGTQS